MNLCSEQPQIGHSFILPLLDIQKYYGYQSLIDLGRRLQILKPANEKRLTWEYVCRSGSSALVQRQSPNPFAIFRSEFPHDIVDSIVVRY